MKIALLNGNPSAKNAAFDTYLTELKGQLDAAGHTVKALTLRDMEAGYCTGCWSCWVRTPGLCLYDDDSRQVCRDVIRSDFVLFASPVIMGYLSAMMKKFMDKLIPLIHPYITVVEGEAHHHARYDQENYPVGGLLLEKTPGTDDEDIDIIRSIHERTALNMKSRNAFTLLTEQPVEEVVHAINHL